MGYNFIECERDQMYLLPVSMRDWLSEDHLAWFILDAVQEMDLSRFYRRYRSDGWGRAAVCLLRGDTFFAADREVM